MTKKFIIVIDAQFDFMMPQGKLYVPGAENTIVPGIAFLQGLKPETTAGVLFTFDTHDADTYYDMPESKQFTIHCERGTTGWNNVFNPELVDQTIPIYTLEKGVFNMWEEPKVQIEHHYGEELPKDREEFFKELKAKGIDTVILLGVAADFCVKWATDGLVERGFNVEIPRNLTAGIVEDVDTVVNKYFPVQVKVI